MSTTTHMTKLETWLPSLEGVADRLRSGAMVADVGSGTGGSTILMAQEFPRSAFAGYDPDAAAVASARALAREAVAASLSGRNVRFDVCHADAIPAYAYDLVITSAALEDLGEPAAVAGHIRRAIAEDGTWLSVLDADADLAAVVAILDGAGFSHIRVVGETPHEIALEVRP